jgi:hypothetical protein
MAIEVHPRLQKWVAQLCQHQAPLHAP